MLADFMIYASGLCAASVCTSLTDEEATRRINAEMPTGITHSWTIATKPFRTGQPNPCQCNSNPETHRHILFHC